MTSAPIGYGLSVRFRTAIVPKDRRRRAYRAPTWSEWSPNLITDAGLDMPASYVFHRCFYYFAVGTGTRPTKRDSGTITATRSGSTVTASAGFFEAGDVNRTLKLDTGLVTRITAFNSATEVTVADAGTSSASEFTIWYTSDNAHEAEVLRFAATGGGAGEQTTRIDGATIIYRRTGTSGVFGAPAILREIGWAPASSGNLFGRALIPGGGDSVTAGQQYKVQVELSVTLSPATPTAAANIGSGMNSSGQYGFTAWGYDALGAAVGGEQVLATLQPGNDNANAKGIEPSNAGDFRLALAAGSPGVPALALGQRTQTDTLFGYGAISRAAYVAGSRAVTWTLALTATEWSGTFGGLRIGWGSYAENWRHEFATPVTKTSLQTLSLSVTARWDRVLNN